MSAVPAGHYKSVGTIAATGVDGIVGSATFDGATDTAAFVTFVRERLAPGRRPGQVVVFNSFTPSEVEGSPRVDALALRLRSGWRPGRGSCGCRRTRRT